MFLWLAQSKLEPTNKDMNKNLKYVLGSGWVIVGLFFLLLPSSIETTFIGISLFIFGELVLLLL